jgi:hypothetical protein
VGTDPQNQKVWKSHRRIYPLWLFQIQDFTPLMTSQHSPQEIHNGEDKTPRSFSQIKEN